MRGAASPLTEGDVLRVLEDDACTSLVAQPIVDLRRGVNVGYEMLARFAIDKPAPPDRVFAAAVELGLGERLEARMIGRALDVAQTRPSDCFVTINTDPRHLTSNEVCRVLDARADLRGIVFELTEHRSIDDLDKLKDALAALRKRGAFVALDDAGSGYSGLKQILELRPHFLKIDRDLVSNVNEIEAKRAMIQMLGDLAGRLDAWVIAEGIETEAELHALSQLHVPLGQGYFLARPAAPWAPVDGKAASALESTSRVSLMGALSIESFVEPCAVCTDSVDWPSVEIAVQLDASKRPAAMRLIVEGGPRVRRTDELMRVKRGETLEDVALRASTRPANLRWDPLVCVNERGHFQGIIPLHRLLAGLARRDPSAVVDSSATWQSAEPDVTMH